MKAAKENVSACELYRLVKRVNEIYASNLSWEAKYDLIFSKRFSKQIDSMIKFPWNNPDASVKDDVVAYVHALNFYMDGELGE